MTKYNYLDAVKQDVLEYINEDWTREQISAMDREEFEEQVYEIAWTEDSITGNGSGSYTFSTWQAEENLCHNLDLLQEAMEEFGYKGEGWLESPETLDCLIRCYLLRQAISEIVEEEGYFD